MMKNENVKVFKVGLGLFKSPTKGSLTRDDSIKNIVNSICTKAECRITNHISYSKYLAATKDADLINET